MPMCVRNNVCIYSYKHTITRLCNTNILTSFLSYYNVSWELKKPSNFREMCYFKMNSKTLVDLTTILQRWQLELQTRWHTQWHNLVKNTFYLFRPMFYKYVNFRKGGILPLNFPHKKEFVANISFFIYVKDSSASKDSNACISLCVIVFVIVYVLYTLIVPK